MIWAKNKANINPTKNKDDTNAICKWSNLDSDKNFSNKIIKFVVFHKSFWLIKRYTIFRSSKDIISMIIGCVKYIYTSMFKCNQIVSNRTLKPLKLNSKRIELIDYSYYIQIITHRLLNHPKIWYSFTDIHFPKVSTFMKTLTKYPKSLHYQKNSIFVKYQWKLILRMHWVRSL